MKIFLPYRHYNINILVLLEISTTRYFIIDQPQPNTTTLSVLIIYLYYVCISPLLSPLNWEVTKEGIVYS